MTLRELSYEYKAHADTLSLRMKQLRLAARETEDPERRHRLERRILELRPLLQEARELAVLTRNYYDRGITRMKSIPYDRRRNTLSSDMAAYMRAVAPDNDEAVSRLKRNLRIARREELTARQAQVLRLYFEEEMTMEAVGHALGISKSTVSRTIARAKQRLKRCLRYAL